MKVSQCTQFLKMQNECLDMLLHLIEYDKEQEVVTGEKAEKSFALKAFVDTQKKALAMAELLLEKHKDSLLEIEKKADEEERKKREAENAKRKAEQKKLADKKNTKKAKTEENSLFGEEIEQEEEKIETKVVEFDKFRNKTDEDVDCQGDYGFEETDMDGDEE